MNPIAIMLGRLSPAPAGRAQAFPLDRWRREFDAAAACGFDQIEWLVTAEHVAANPLFTPAGVIAITAAIADSGVLVRSLCADCFVSWPLLRAEALEQRRLSELLARTIDAAAAIGARVIVVPAIEAGAVQTNRDQETLLTILDAAIARAEQRSIQLALETDLPGDRLRSWLDAAGSPAMAACYDIGNAAALGRDARADLTALGPRLAAVHVKDRRRSGPSVPLGRGDADLPRAFHALAQIGFVGPLVLETPVGRDPIAAALRHRAVVSDAWDAARLVRR